MDLKPGSRWRSAVCEAEVVVVRPPKSAAVLECGAQPMAAFGSARPEGLSPPTGSVGVLVGKRYFDEESGLEVLCSKAGASALSLDGRPLGLKQAKKLPSSD
jgi:hypothetical protein